MRPPAVPKKLLIVLEGPFAIVLKPKEPERIQVFVPMDTMRHHHGHHAVLVNGDNRPHDKLHNLKLAFSDDTLRHNDKLPRIDKCLEPFHWKSSWSNDNPRDVIELANLHSPDRLYCTKIFSKATFESGAHAKMSSGHILEYTICKPLNPVWIEDQQGKRTYPLFDPKDPRYAFFSIQVGLPKDGTEPDPNGSHARSFHNDLLLSRFPTIKSDPGKRLKLITRTPSASISGTPIGLLSTAVECKGGGVTIAAIQ